MHAYHTARWLSAEGHDVQIVTVESITSGPTEGVYAVNDEYRGLKVHRLSFNCSNQKDLFSWEYDNPWIYQDLFEYFHQMKPDLFHLFSGYLLGAGAIKAAISNQVPVVITLTDFWFFCPRINMVKPDGEISDAITFDARNCTRCKFEERRRYLWPALFAPRLADKFWTKSMDADWSRSLGIESMHEEFILRNSTLVAALSSASAIICPSKFLMDSAHKRGLPEEKIHFIQHGIDKSDWILTRERKRNELFRIGYLGQLDQNKGIHLLIKAFQHLPDELPLELKIYGDDSPGTRYIQYIKKLAKGDPRIKFLGKYEYRKVADILTHLDGIVIPSIWNEIGPLVMYEALEVKTPIIASNIPNMSDIIQHEENGLLFECGDWNDLASQLLRMIEEDDLCDVLIEKMKPVRSFNDEMQALDMVYQGTFNNVEIGLER